MPRFILLYVIIQLKKVNWNYLVKQHLVPHTSPFSSSAVNCGCHCPPILGGPQAQKRFIVAQNHLPNFEG